MVAVLCAAPVSLAATVVEPRLGLMLEERYDDDFRLSGSTGGQLMTKVSPRLGLEVKNSTLQAEGFYAADVLARHGSGRVTLDHRSGLSLQKTLSRRLKVELSGRFFRVTDPTSLPRESVARSAQPVLFGDARAYVTGRLTQRVAVGVGYQLEGARVLDGESIAGFSHATFAEAWLSTTRRMALGGGYRHQLFSFGEEVAQAHGVFGGLRYRLSRQLSFGARGGPVSYAANDGTRGLLPRVRLELEHDGERLDVAAIAGHDLVGATGFASALWADYAGLVVHQRFDNRLSAYAMGSVFRNGRAPGEGAFTLGGDARVAQGYALGARLEFKVNPYVTLQASLDRIAQVGMGGAEVAVGLTRNVAAVRLHLTAW